MQLMILGHAAAPIKSWNPWGYRVNPIADTTTPLFLKKVSSLISPKRLALLFDQTQEGQLADADVVRRLPGEIGYEIVSADAFRGGDQDFSPQIANLKNANPDAIYIAASVADGIKIVNQLRGVGVELPIITGYGSFLDPLYWEGTNGSIKGGYTWIAQDIQGAKGKLKDFLDKYNAKNKLQATSYSSYGYDSVYSVVECIKRSGSIDREAMRQAMSSLEFDTPIGTRITFKNPPTGENLTPKANTIRVTGLGTYEVV
jgi:branched-chain amino acid transport system substrate-binding protein